MRIISRLLAVLYFLALSFSVSSASAADLRIGWIDVQKVIVSSKQGQAANKELEAKAMSYKKKFTAEKKKVDEMKKKLASLKTVGSEEAIRSQERDLDRKLQELDLESKYASKDMKDLQKKKLAPVIDELNEVINELGKSEHYDYILDSRTLLFAAEKNDITDKAVAAMNKRAEAHK